MSIPSVNVTKVDGGTGVVRPSATGCLAIIAPSASGSANVAETSLRSDVALASYGSGPLVECQAYVQPVSGKPVVLVKGTAATAAAYGTVALTGTGTSVPTGDGVTLPNDDYDVKIVVTTGGTVGVDGMKYTYSLDGGVTTSAIRNIGTAAYILITHAGVKIDLAAGTLVAGDVITVKTTGPKMTNANLVTALEALRVSQAPFEGVLWHGAADATTVSNLDTWLNAMALTGRFKFAVCTARPRATDGSETEAQYKTAMQTAFAASASINVIVCADVGDVSSPIPGRDTTACVQQRPVGWCLAARAMKIALGRDPACGDDGPVSQFAITDSKGNPNHHDEFMNPGLDDLRLCTLRTFDQQQGVYITNAPGISTSGSDYVYLQHVRTINRACEIAFQILAKALSRGVAKNPKAGPNGERYIAEGDALRVEATANAAIRGELAGQVDDVKFSVARTDNIASNAGATVTGKIESVALAYIKHFTVTAGFVKSLSA